MNRYSKENLILAREINTSDKDYLEWVKSVQMETVEHFQTEHGRSCGHMWKCPFEGLEYLLSARL